MIEKQRLTLTNCPFCAHVLNPDHPDTIHPSGVYWHYDENCSSKVYCAKKETSQELNACWQINCDVSSGGCGASISGDSIEEAVRKWNRRDFKKPVLILPKSGLSFKMFAQVATYKGSKVFLNVGSKDFTSSHRSVCPVVPVLVTENSGGEYYGFVSSDGELSNVYRGLASFNFACNNQSTEKNEGIVLRLSIADSPMCLVCGEHAIDWDLEDLKLGRREVRGIVEYHCSAASLKG